MAQKLGGGGRWSELGHFVAVKSVDKVASLRKGDVS